MATLAPRRAKPTPLPADPAWPDLYRVGGWSSLAAATVYVLATGAAFTAPPAPTTDGIAILQYIAEHRTAYILQQVLWVAPCALLMLVFLALFPALQAVNRSYAAIGALLGIMAWGVPLYGVVTGGGAPALVYLSDQYVIATTDATRVAMAGAAEGLIALNNIPSMIGVLEAGSVLVVSLMMLHGVFRPASAYVGIATGVVGVGCEALKLLLGMWYAAYGVLLLIWLVTVGVDLLRLYRTAVRSPSPHGARATIDLASEPWGK